MDLTGRQEQTAPPPFAVASHKAIPAGIFLQRHPVNKHYMQTAQKF